jgi:outer membrane protein OmpA-like peptidoglycan-associated protein
MAGFFVSGQLSVICYTNLTPVAMKKLYALLALLCMYWVNAQQKQLYTVVYFAVNEDSPLPGEYDRLLADLKDAKVLSIYGHADTTATTQYNQRLSDRRAKTIAAYLKSKAVNLNGADVKGFGEQQSLDGGLITDRRVVVAYEKQESKANEKPAQTNLTEQVSNARKGDKLTLKNMNFENNSDIMLPSSRPVLAELLRIMKDNPKLKIEIQGHICCQTEDTTHVSDGRAFMVYTYLSANGIEAERLSHKGLGSSQPIYPLPEQDEEQRVANRRVEIEILEN